MGDDRKADSIVNAEARSKKIREESAAIEQQMREADAKRKQQQIERENEIRQVEDEAVENVCLVSSEETREQLLDRIREMRNEKPPEVIPVAVLTDRMINETNAEQDLGRRMVAKAEAELARSRAIRAQAEADERIRKGQMQQVFQNNPGANEAFPVNKATFGKPKQ